MVDHIGILAVHLDDLGGLSFHVVEIRKRLQLDHFLALHRTGEVCTVLVTPPERVYWKEAGFGSLLHFHLVLKILRLLRRPLIPLLAVLRIHFK